MHSSVYSERDHSEEYPKSPSTFRKYTKATLYFYLVPFFLCPILLISAAIAIVPTTWFADRSHVQYLVTMGYGAKLRNTTCDVVIYGDSSAMIGIRPEIIRKQNRINCL